MNPALSPSFLFPLAAAAAVLLHVLKGRRARGLALVCANLAFLIVLFRGGEGHLAALVAALLVNYGGLRWIAASPRQGARIGAALIFLDVAALGLVQFSAIQALLTTVLPSLRVRVFDVLGGSFALLRLIHLLAETAGGPIDLDFVDYLNFMLFFPAFLVGPLDRYPRFQADLERAPALDWRRVYESLRRIVEGEFKLQVLGWPLSLFSLASMTAADASRLPPLKLCVALLAFSVDLYLMFSGATDLAIGLAWLLGVSLPENFNRPYLARNLQDFWYRWHMSFVSWLRDYLYFPLAYALSSGDLMPVWTAALLSLVTTFVLAGIWHGAGANFAWYGVYHAAGFALFLGYRLALESFLPPHRLAAYRRSRLIDALARALTLAFVCGGFFLFLNRAAQAAALIRRLL